MKDTGLLITGGGYHLLDFLTDWTNIIVQIVTIIGILIQLMIIAKKYWFKNDLNTLSSDLKTVITSNNEELPKYLEDALERKARGIYNKNSHLDDKMIVLYLSTELFITNKKSNYFVNKFKTENYNKILKNKK